MAIPVAQKSQSEAQNKEEMKRVEKEEGGKKSHKMINSKERSLSYNFLILKASE